MKKTKLFLLLVILLVISSCNQTRKDGGIITQKAFKKISSSTNIQLVDVRTPGEYKQGFIKGAVLVNYRDPNFVSKANAIVDKNEPVYLYCGVGGRSNKAMMQLVEAGFKEVYSLEGGYREWIKNQKE